MDELWANHKNSLIIGGGVLSGLCIYRIFIDNQKNNPTVGHAYTTLQRSRLNEGMNPRSRDFITVGGKKSKRKRKKRKKTRKK